MLCFKRKIFLLMKYFLFIDYLIKHTASHNINSTIFYTSPQYRRTPRHSSVIYEYYEIYYVKVKHTTYILDILLDIKSLICEIN